MLNSDHYLFLHRPSFCLSGWLTSRGSLLASIVHKLAGMKVGGLFVPLYSQGITHVKLDLFKKWWGIIYESKGGSTWKSGKCNNCRNTGIILTYMWICAAMLQKIAKDRKFPLPTSREIRYLQARHIILRIVVLVPKSGDFIPAANPHVISQTLGIVKKVFEPLGSSRPSH